MATENLEEFSLAKLIRRKRLIVATLVILIFATVADGAIVIYDLVRGNGFNTMLFIPAIACLGFVFLMYSGLMKINEELAKRNNAQ